MCSWTYNGHKMLFAFVLWVTISRAKIHFLIPFMAINSEGYFTMKNLGNAILNFDTLTITGSAQLLFTSFSIPYHKIPISQMALNISSWTIQSLGMIMYWQSFLRSPCNCSIILVAKNQIRLSLKSFNLMLGCWKIVVHMPSC